jgi:hypothetical protein
MYVCTCYDNLCVAAALLLVWRCHPAGVILLQMLTGKDAGRVVSVVEAALARCQGDPASFATIIDPRSGNWPITEAASFAHLAMRCVELSRGNRPDLRGEVLPALLQLLERASLYDSARAVKRSVSLSSSVQPPSMFICPITQVGSSCSATVHLEVGLDTWSLHAEVVCHTQQ